jgi:hypothetical protein
MSAFVSPEKLPVKLIPVGYAGFVPGLLSENFHGAPWKVQQSAFQSQLGLMDYFINRTFCIQSKPLQELVDLQYLLMQHQGKMY